MLDFSPIFKGEVTLGEFTAGFTSDDLRRLTNEMVDTMLGMIADCADADVTFQPSDPDAHDSFAASGAETDLAWTLGHVVVHTTASSEEAAFAAAELARGVPEHGRTRYEVPWETVTTIAQCRQRLEESRRMRLASLDMWPDQPHMDNTVEFSFLRGPVNPSARFVLGLLHDNSHVGQIAEIVRQASAARS